MAKGDLFINPTFEPIFSDELTDKRYYQLYGGRGSGKSFVASVAAVDKTYSKYKHRVLYLRQTMTSSEDSTIADVRMAIEILGVAADFREKKGVITNIRTGGTISFKGIRSTGSQSAKLKSLSGITTLIIEEAEEVESFDEFSKIDESIRIAGKPLKVILIYNPTSAIKSWIHAEWFENGRPLVSRFKDTEYLHSTYLDNLDNLAKSAIDRYNDLKETNPTYYRNTILAEWTLGSANRIYAGWGIIPELEQSGDTWYGLDFGYGGKDKTACVKITWIEGVYYVELVFSESKLSITSIARKLRKGGVPFNAKIFADSAAPILIKELRDKGFTSISKAKKGKVREGIKKVQDKAIVLVRNDEKDPLYTFYMTFSENGKGELPHEPDELAAMRYGINSKKPMKKPARNKKRKARRRKTKGFL
ncbi:terminase large subunit [Tenacibaculum phage Larrie]|nr:terminase large subunit [Tenacibaculum phage Larrie]